MISRGRWCWLTLGLGLEIGCGASTAVVDDELFEDSVSVENPIIGGVRANAYPEAALISMRSASGGAACSGSVIAPKVVLTAGHCIVGMTRWTVTTPYAGSQKSSTNSATTFDYKSTSENVAPNQHDVGLIFLTTPITLTSYPTIATTALPDGSPVIDIGRIQNGRLSNTDLFWARVTVSDARRIGFPFDYVSKEVIESGDSGGPVETETGHTIVAVNSGAGGGTQVLARTDLVSDWISQQIAAHGGTGPSGGGTTPGTGGLDAGTASPPSGACPVNETEPNDSYRQAGALDVATCGQLSSGSDQDWFTFTLGAAGIAYDVRVSAATDAEVRMWKLVNGSYQRVANTSPTELAHTSSAPGTYVVAVFSPSGQTGGYTIAR
jgi:hypothetical protein